MTTMTTTRSSLAALLACAAGCATTAGGTGATGYLDPHALRAAAAWRGPARIELRTDGSGQVTKLEVVHGAAAEVPAAVKALVERTLPGAGVKHYELERYAGEDFAHEVEVTRADGVECEVSARPDATLRYVECAGKKDDLPVPVLAALGRLLPGAEYAEVETRKGPGVDELSAELKRDGVVHYVRLRPDGTVVEHLVQVPATIEVPAP